MFADGESGCFLNADDVVFEAEIGVDVECRLRALFQRRRHDPDQAVFLRDRQPAQAVTAAVEIPKRRAVGDADQPAGEVVRPAVVAAEEALRLALRGLEQRRAAMLARQGKVNEARAMIQACFASSDYKEGREAFAQKRTPQFQGR